jgi:GT2 family glycosyltransferase
LVCLLNNDVEITSPDWLRPMAALAVREDIGAVGARLLYSDGAIQHAGVALGIGDAAGHVDKGARPLPGEFAPWHGESRTVSAVTAACLLVDRAKFIEVGGMDEETFAVDFNDVDLCLKLAARSWRTAYCAQATLIHHESRSRGKTHHGADLARFEQELSALRARWRTDAIVDPHHSPLFRRQSERCLLAF